MRTAARMGCALVTMATLTAIAVISPISGEASATPRAKSKDLAAEVCEDMVRDAAVAAADEPLAGPQAGTWNGNRYTCRYTFAGGALRLRVDVMRDAAAAKAAFASTKTRSKVRTRLFGIGEQGFQAANGSIVARKDNFVLTVDPTDLPRRLNRDAITWSSTRAVFDCW